VGPRHRTHFGIVTAEGEGLLKPGFHLFLAAEPSPAVRLEDEGDRQQLLQS
jgi:hypothetical protein